VKTFTLALSVAFGGCMPFPFPRQYWVNYLEKAEGWTDFVLPDSRSVSSRARYHPFFIFSKDEAMINYMGKLLLRDSALCFLPDTIQSQKWPEIKPFRIRLSTIIKSTVNYETKPVSLLIEAGDVTYLFYTDLSEEQKQKYKAVLTNTESRGDSN